MSSPRTADDDLRLIRELCNQPSETEWIEFKENNWKPDDIGEYISALANSAALLGKTTAYVVWGVADGDHSIVGTSFVPMQCRVGNEELENWLLKNLKPKIQFHFRSVAVDGKNVILLEIGSAFRHPTSFKNTEYLRVSSYKKQLKDFPEKERALWRALDQVPFEKLLAAERLQVTDALSLIDAPAYFEMLKRVQPESHEATMRELIAAGIALRSEQGIAVTNLGAALFAKRMEDFPSLKRKPIRVIQYKGRDRTQTLKEQNGVKGYANGFDGLIAYVNGLLPSNEVVGRALRQTVPMYPEIAIREIVANALIHQDFFISGAGPMIEVFEDRIEVTNPGIPLMDTNRFLDTPPRSRNESLASMMRLAGVCEERGSGVDKVVFQSEFYQLPAPLFEQIGENTRVVLFAHQPLAVMSSKDKIRACYLHASLRYVNRNMMTNTSIRERFGISADNSAIASRLIGAAVDAGSIRPYDSEAGKKYMKYVPFWA